jgi:hypothetical protein
MLIKFQTFEDVVFMFNDSFENIISDTKFVLKQKWILEKNMM